MCLARAVPKRGGSCGNSPQAADGSVLFRSMPFPCPQNIRSLIMAARRRQQPATVRFNYVLRCSRPTPLRARSACYATLRNFGVACSERSLNYRYLAKIRSKPDDSQGKKGWLGTSRGVASSGENSSGIQRIGILMRSFATNRASVESSARDTCFT